MQWDHEVDLVSVGSGAGGLATAIVAVDGGETVFVAQSRRWSPYRLGVEVSDHETNTYLDAVTDVARTARANARGVDLPVRLVDVAVPGSLSCNRRGVVEPFVGAHLGNWAADCLAAPHAVLYSRVTDRHMALVRSISGGNIEAAVVGSLDPDRDGWVIDDWLSAQAQRRGIDVHEDSSLERLVFVDGRVVGAVVMTPDGPCAVAARRGVVVASGRHCVGGAAADRMSVETPLQVCVVSQIASRFGRVELLARPRAGSRLAPTRQNRQPRSRKLSSRVRCHGIAPGQVHDGGP